ncbi:M16 family metallopeptidase [Sphaerimonospora thailandensis]|uniref:Zinc protease n=1 Tax=Sphaerimonospora thailandensis TaxID=795644 RepID=A0A8J3RBS6_9ACTN|nr:pitrilysin family protein [Sphaerimonospora thailandensis]GIH72113.1 zinc protease [Sphaerimonospora thailandensis]
MLMTPARLPMEVVSRRLPGGATVIVRPDPLLGFVALNVWHSTGSIHDPAGRSGLAHLVEHVMSDPAEGAAESVQPSGSTQATTAYECTNYVDTGPPETLPELLSRAVERIRRGRAGITAAGLERQRGIVREEIRQREESGRFGSGLRRSLRLLFGADHPFGKPPLGDPEEIAEITPVDVERFIECHYGAARLVVSIVGSVHPEHAMELAARHLGGLPAGPRPETPVLSGPEAGGYRREDVREGQRTGMLRYAFALPAAGEHLSAAGEVVMAALAGASWSVLGADLADYYRLLGSMAQHGRCGCGPSLGLIKIVAPAGVDLCELEDAVTTRLADLAGTGLREDVLAAAKAKRGKEQLAVLGGARTCAEELCREQAWSGDPAGVTGRLAAVRAVTADQVAEIAAGSLARPAVVAFHTDPLGNPTWIA